MKPSNIKKPEVKPKPGAVAANTASKIGSETKAETQKSAIMNTPKVEKKPVTTSTTNTAQKLNTPKQQTKVVTKPTTPVSNKPVVKDVKSELEKNKNTISSKTLTTQASSKAISTTAKAGSNTGLKTVTKAPEKAINGKSVIGDKSKKPAGTTEGSKK